MERTGIQTVLIDPKTAPKAYEYARKRLVFMKVIEPFHKYSDLGNDILRQFLYKAQIIKSHEILKCSGCNSCNVDEIVDNEEIEKRRKVLS